MPSAEQALLPVCWNTLQPPRAQQNPCWPDSPEEMINAAHFPASQASINSWQTEVQRLAEKGGPKGPFPVDPKGNQPWIFTGRTDAEAETPILLATWCEQLTHLKRPWCWERLNAGGEGDNRGWNGWMASPTQWAWAWVNSRSWWRTGRPGMLQSMGSQRVGYNWVTELNLWSWACPLIFSWEMCDDSKENAGNAWKISPKWIYTYTLVQFILNSTRCSFLFSCVLLS